MSDILLSVVPSLTSTVQSVNHTHIHVQITEILTVISNAQVGIFDTTHLVLILVTYERLQHGALATPIGTHYTEVEAFMYRDGTQLQWSHITVIVLRIRYSVGVSIDVQTGDIVERLIESGRQLDAVDVHDAGTSSRNLTGRLHRYGKGSQMLILTLDIN